jgi:branched-chain amino acid transport system ATP-binding protein
MPEMALLEATDVNSYYGSSHVLYDVSLAIEEGALVTLVGRNGAGKSTTLKSVMGLVQPRSGTIAFDGEDITGNDPHETAQKGVAFIPETRRIFPYLTVGENLRLGYVGHDVDEPIESMRERVFGYFPRLEERIEQTAGQMSGGEQQMLAIGRGLMSNPDVLLIDEPTEGLMPTLVQELAEILAEINENGTTMLLVEQNVDLALRISDYAYLIDEGAMVFEGDSDAVRENEDVKSRYLSV